LIAAGVTGLIADTGPLDLDDVRTKLSEDHAGHWPGDDVAELKHPQAR
jgi:hypothetical protein